MSGHEDIARVRGFNRLVTRQVGALQDRYLGHRPLGESRVLFEIGTEGATPRDVRARLGLDSGYLSGARARRRPTRAGASATTSPSWPSASRSRLMAEAQTMYRTHGYTEIPRYNDEPYANHWFEKRLAQ